MNRWRNYYIDGIFHFVTASVYQWQKSLDDSAAEILYAEWDKVRNQLSVKVLAYVIMPDHIHLLLWAEKGENIKDFMQSVLSRSSKRIGSSGKFWKERMRVVCVQRAQGVKTKLDYLHKNPIKAELVENPEDWRHSSFAQLELRRPAEQFECDSWPEGIFLP